MWMTETKQCGKCNASRSVIEFREDCPKGDLCNKCYNNWAKVKKYHKTPRGRAVGLLNQRCNGKIDRSKLSVDFVLKGISSGRCELTGIPFDLAGDGFVFNSPSIDRIDPSKGYTEDNCRIVCRGVNLMMNTWGIGMVLKVADAYRAKHAKVDALLQWANQPVGA